jgi:hypothetical protein
MGMVAHSSSVDCQQILARSWHRKCLAKSLPESLIVKARISLTQASPPIPSVENNDQVWTGDEYHYRICDCLRLYRRQLHGHGRSHRRALAALRARHHRRRRHRQLHHGQPDEGRERLGLLKRLSSSISFISS